MNRTRSCTGGLFGRFFFSSVFCVYFRFIHAHIQRAQRELIRNRKCAMFYFYVSFGLSIRLTGIALTLNWKKNPHNTLSQPKLAFAKITTRTFLFHFVSGDFCVNANSSFFRHPKKNGRKKLFQRMDSWNWICHIKMKKKNIVPVNHWKWNWIMEMKKLQMGNFNPSRLQKRQMRCRTKIKAENFKWTHFIHFQSWFFPSLSSGLFLTIFSSFFRRWWNFDCGLLS